MTKSPRNSFEVVVTGRAEKLFKAFGSERLRLWQEREDPSATIVVDHEHARTLRGPKAIDESRDVVQHGEIS
jgi:hypothetical protein